MQHPAEQQLTMLRARPHLDCPSFLLALARAELCDDVMTPAAALMLHTAALTPACRRPRAELGSYY